MHLPIRIIHTADLHLGAPFSALPEFASRMKQEQMVLFSRLISRCATEKPDLLLIAGDLFDQPVPPPSLVSTVMELLASIPQTEVFICSGNHDPAFIDSPYRTARWPEHVHLFTDELTSFELADKPVRVLGAGFTAAASTRSLLPVQPQPVSADRTNLLVLHADLVTQGQSSVYNPVTVGQINALGVDYAALGHRHERLGPLTAGAGHYAYCGCPMGRGFDESGEKGIISLLLPEDKRQLVSEWVPLATRKFLEQAVSIDDCLSHEAVLAKIQAVLRHENGAGWQENLYRIILNGKLDDNFSLVPAILQPRLSEMAMFIETVDRTSRIPDIQALAQENSLCGAFVRLMMKQIEDAERVGASDQVLLTRQALLLGLAAFNGEVPEHAYP